MEIVRERLEREFDLALIATAPSVEYLAHLTNGDEAEVDNPADMPPPNQVDYIEEPFLTSTIVTPTSYTGTVMELCQGGRSDLEKVDILLNGVAADAFSAILHRSKADEYGRKMTEKLKELIPRQQYDVPIQAAMGGRIIARSTVKAMRKDVIAKCYGGDITRKHKLLDKQKEGKKRMKSIGRVE